MRYSDKTRKADNRTATYLFELIPNLRSEIGPSLSTVQPQLDWSSRQIRETIKDKSVRVW